MDELPRLIGRRGLMDELGVKSGTADGIMRQLEQIRIGRRVYVRRADVAQLIRDHTIRPQSSPRPPPLSVVLDHLDTPVPVEPLPRLLSIADLRARLGVTEATAWAIVRTSPAVLLPLVRRTFVRGDLLDNQLRAPPRPMAARTRQPTRRPTAPRSSLAVGGRARRAGARRVRVRRGSAAPSSR